MVEKEHTDTLISVCQRHKWTITNFHVAPLFDPPAAGRPTGGHEWWVELRRRSTETPTGPVPAAEIHRELQELNADYAARRQGGGMAAPVVRLVMPGVFERWMRARDAWGGHHKMPRCRADRRIADDLGQLAPFSTDQARSGRQQKSRQPWRGLRWHE